MRAQVAIVGAAETTELGAVPHLSQLGLGAERHERDQFTPVDEDGERPFRGDLGRAKPPVLVEHLDLLRERGAGVAQAGQGWVCRRAHRASVPEQVRTQWVQG